MKRTLVEYLDARLGRHVGSHPELTWFCPACIDRVGSESTKPKLHINVAAGIGHCYRCEYGFRSLESLFRLINAGEIKIEELRIIRREITPKSNTATEAIRDVLQHDPAATRLRPVMLPEGTFDLWRRPLPHVCQTALRYLAGRGVDSARIRKHRIGYCVAGRYAGYLTFPVLQEGRHVYFATRFAGKAERKSNNPPKRPGYYAKSHCLLNFDGCRGHRTIAIVEGPFDMMAWPHAVALLGKDISAAQVRLVERLVELGTRRVIVSLDADAGKFAHSVYSQLLGRVPDLRMLSLADGDPFDHRDEISELVKEAGEPDSKTLVQARYRKGSVVRRRKVTHHARS